MAAVVSLCDGKGALVGDLEIKSFRDEGFLPSDIAKSVYFRVVLNNLGQFTSSTKTRGEVNRSNKRPWRQKGTGRARCGGAASPLWRKGGILFGPRPGGRELDVNRKHSKAVWRWMFADFFEKRAIVCLDLQKDSFGISTANARRLLESIAGRSAVNVKTFTLLVPGVATIEGGAYSSVSDEMSRAFRNLDNVFVESFDRKDIRSLIKSDMILFFKNDENLFEEMVAKHGTN